MTRPGFDYMSSKRVRGGVKVVEKCQGEGGDWQRVSVLVLFYAIATAFQYSSDMMHKMGRRKPEPTLLQTQGIPHHIGMV